MASVIIGGDVCPIGRSLPLFVDGKAEEIFTDILCEFEHSDLTIVNLECPLILSKSPILKNGPVLGTCNDSILGFKKSYIDLLNLGNNHIMDHGEKGLMNTIKVCLDNNIDYVGAGFSLDDAREIYIRKLDDLKVGIISVAEHEYSIAEANKGGANPLDIISFVRTVKKYRKDFDYLIVLFHGGKEHYPYPSPNLQKTCRFMVEEGANAVICQHSHCAGSYEFYQNAHIVYGQGNLVFDKYPTRHKKWHQGFLVKLEISKTDSCMEIIPFEQFNEIPNVRKLKGEINEKFLFEIDKRSEAILDPEFVSMRWGEFCQINKYSYISRLRGHNRFLRYLNRKIHFTDYAYANNVQLAIRNMVECETHREVIIELLKEYGGEYASEI